MNGLRQKILCLFFLLLATPCLAMRDIFNLSREDFASNPLMKINLSDLNFVGALIQRNRCVGFVEDSIGNIYPIYLGQQIGVAGAKVLKILQDQILLLQGQSFYVIK